MKTSRRTRPLRPWPLCASPVLVLLTLVVAPSTAAAQIPGLPAFGDEDQQVLEAQDEVIQNRKYDLTNELSVLGGGFFVDPYYKGVTGTLAYTIHLSDFWAWEVVQGTYSFNLDTTLKDEVQRVARAQGQTVPEFAEIQWMATSRLVLKPIYGKQAIFNTEVMHIEAFLAAGPAVLSRADGDASIAIGGDVGGGFRFWVSELVAVRLDIAQLLYFEGSNFETDLRLHLGFSFNLRSED
ncbi:MAG: outer membrane beta-barrel domain-containing protein [Myxococcota bacterium]